MTECIGPYFGNDYDVCPCDEPNCPICPDRKREFERWRNNGARLRRPLVAADPAPRCSPEVAVTMTPELEAAVAT